MIVRSNGEVEGRTQRRERESKLPPHGELYVSAQGFYTNTTKCKAPEEGGTEGRVGHQRASSPTRSCACQFWAAAGTNAGEQKVTAGGSQRIRGPERDSVSSTPELSWDRAPQAHVYPTRLCATPSPTWIYLKSAFESSTVSVMLEL